MIKKTIGAILACAVLTTTMSACSGAGTPAQTSQKTITVAEVPGFDDTVAVTALWTELLSEHGYNLETKTVDLAAGFSGIARGDLDGYLNAWLPSTHASYVEKYRDDLVVLDKNGPFFDNDRLVLAVPKSVEENTISEVLKNAEKYDSRIVGIEAGAGMMKLLPDVLKTYGAEGKLDIVAGSTPAALAALKDGAAKNKPVVATLWTPHWAFASMPIKALEDDMSGWPKPDGSYVVLSKKFNEEEPQVAEWMSKSKLTEEQFASLMLAVSETKTAAEGAKKWLENAENRAAADAWFK
ncbi:glycine betaine ABC transporter substrate-binding protein [Arthrobacter sp. CDRTa11]|uniref:glycine betaine ABC transporter substrate-binding protein n=1 Tax=Arthrobacter sp. CDRTa11 TaxID=2651199 RepID=UPI0022657E90|nr:glycine betaine ABC transporter substrate-binding protein [Arthrobacter sp. CDRTa11]UZX03076.1 glycine betaine ABC transporter substrate-binding protein [Arthrobacter sp. CDRTa11]